MRKKVNSFNSAIGLSRGEALGVRSGSRKRMPSRALSVGRDEAVRPGLNSKSMALGRSMGRIKGPSPARALSRGASLGVRLAEGGHLGMEDRDDMRRLRLSSERDEKLETPHYKKGGSIHKTMKDVYKALHSHFASDPAMKKLQAKPKEIYDGEPHRYKKKGGKIVSELWIQGAINPSKKGALHRSLGVPMGKKISESKLEKAEHSKSPLMRKRANLAETLRKLHHRGNR